MKPGPRLTRSFLTDYSVGGERIISGIAVPYGETDLIRDWDGEFHERWAPGAFARSIAERGDKIRDIKALWSHDPQDPPIGTIQRFDEQPDGLHVEIRIAPTATGDDLLTLVREGALDGFSVGFQPVDVAYVGRDADSGLEVREVREAKLREISLVSFPALSKARVLATRSSQPLTKENTMNTRYIPDSDLQQHWTREDFETLAKRDALVGDDGIVAAADEAKYLDLDFAVERADKVAAVARAAKDPKNSIERQDPVTNHRDLIGNPFATSGWSEGTTKERARAAAAIERGIRDSDSAEQATKVLRSIDGSDVAEHLISTSDPDYQNAFRKFMKDPDTGYQTFTDAERKAWGRVKEMKERSSLVLAGAVLPAPLDPSVVLTNAGTIDPVRQVARVEQTTSKDKRFITSAGSTVSFDDELVEVSDGTPTLAEVTIRTWGAKGFVQSSIEAAMDQPDWDQEVVAILGDAKQRLEGTKWIYGAGDGSKEPLGLAAAISSVTSSVVSPTTPEQFNPATDIPKTLLAVPPRHRARAKWMMELSTLLAVHAQETANGSKMYPDAFKEILGKQVYENSNMFPASAINASTTDSTVEVAFCGDFSTFAIVDRIGMTIEKVPHLFNAANNLPDGRSGWYAFWRTGSGLVGEGLAMLNIPTEGA